MLLLTQLGHWVVAGDVETGIVPLGRGNGRKTGSSAAHSRDVNQIFNLLYSAGPGKQIKIIVSVYQRNENNTELLGVTKSFCHCSQAQNHTQSSLHPHQNRNCDGSTL